MIRFILSCLLLVILVSLVNAQCTPWQVYGPPEVCQDSAPNYFVSGPTNCSIVHVSGTNNTFSGSTVTWGGDYGTYQITFDCDCGQIYQSVEILDPATTSAGTIIDLNINEGESATLVASGVTVPVLRWESKEPAQNWSDAITISSTETFLDDTQLDLSTTKDYRLVGSCGGEIYAEGRVNVTPAPEDICGSESIQLSHTASGSVSTAWFSASGDLLAYGNTFQTPVLTATTSYIVKTYDATGAVTQDTKTVNVYPAETHKPNLPTLSKSGTDYIIDKNNTNSGLFTYEWVDSRDGRNGDDGTPSLTTNLYGSIYYLRAINVNGCYGPAVAVQVPTDLVDPDFTTPISTDLSYVRTDRYKEIGITDPTTASTDQVETTYSYYDGLGRSIQEIAKAATPDEKDMVNFLTYDPLGRQAKIYLPFESSVSTGAIVGDPVTAIQDFYSDAGDEVADSDFPYGFTSFDHSPENRPLIQSAPGGDWEYLISGNVETLEKTNNSAVPRFSISGLGPVTTTEYAPGKLFASQLLDENSHRSTTYQRIDGQTLLKEIESEDENGASYFLKTYYIYNDLGQLAIVVPPSAVKQIEEASYNWALLNDVTFRDQWLFLYRYDGRGRMIEKKVPGAGKVEMVYDQKDRLVLLRDGNHIDNSGAEGYVIVSGEESVGTDYVSGTKYAIIPSGELTLVAGFEVSGADDFEATTNPDRFQGNWLFTKYDALDRVLLTGELFLSGSRESLQQTLNGTVAEETYIGDVSGDVHGYSDLSFPMVSIADIHAVNYYDNYDYQIDFTGWGSYGTGTGIIESPGLPTGNLTKLMDPISPAMLKSASHYDDRFRVSKTVNENHLGGLDQVTTSFRNVVSGRVENTVRVHQKAGEADLTISEIFEYDHVDRLTDVKHLITGRPSEVTLSSLSYNKLGELTDKDLHGGSVQEIDYRYNIRGWLKTINGGTGFTQVSGDKFGLELNYVVPSATDKQYNGNIGSMTWKSLDGSAETFDEPQTYTYTYDPSNRLKSATYASDGQDHFFDVDNIQYDPNGNILSLQRRMESSTAFIDDLTYSYAGNQLKRLQDQGHTTDGFEDGSDLATEYTYDANGNMISDANKGITSITYNFLNLPEVVTMDNGIVVTYNYMSDGTKVKKTTNPGGTTDYIAGLHYTDGTKSFIQTREGRFLFSTDQYEYNLTDHLGNVRVTIDESGAVVQRDDYYPGGLSFNSWHVSPKNHYTYSGKEEQQETEWLDYGARMYMPDLWRWNGIDLLADQHTDYTPYAYVYNNPVRFTDQFGLDTLLVDSQGRFSEDALKGGDNDVIIKVSSKEREAGQINYKNGKLRKRHVTSKGFEKGSISTNENANGTLVSTTNEQSEDVFNFLTDNTMVEFSRVEYANTQTQEEENVIMTSHSYDRDPYGTQVTTQFAESPFTQVRSHSHSHPDDPRYKKGPSSKENNGDVAAYQMWTERQGSSIKFFIRVGGVTREYDVDGNLVTPNKQ